MTAAEMHKNAILVTLNISTWSARKYDAGVTKETNAAHGADDDAGRYNKKLLPGDAPEYKAIIQHANEMRDFHYMNTLPWNDDGARILKVTNYQHYTDGMRKGTDKFYALLNDLDVAYPRLRADAKIKLNGMWKDSDYPENIREKFAFSYKPDPMPVTGDLRVELPAAEMAILEKQVEERTKQRLAEAQNDAVRKLHEVVAKMVERLGKTEQCTKCNGKGKLKDSRKNPTFDKLVTCWKCDGDGEVHGEVCKTCNGYKPDGSRVTKVKDTRKFKNNGKKVDCWICNGAGKTEATFRDSLIENAREVADVLKRINLTDDPELEKLRKQTEKLATSNEPETLRSNAEARAAAAEKAQNILDNMTAVYGNIFG